MKAHIVHETRWNHGSTFLLVSTIFGILVWDDIDLAQYDEGIAVVWLANAFFVAQPCSFNSTIHLRSVPPQIWIWN